MKRHSKALVLSMAAIVGSMLLLNGCSGNESKKASAPAASSAVPTASAAPATAAPATAAAASSSQGSVLVPTVYAPVDGPDRQALVDPDTGKVAVPAFADVVVANVEVANGKKIDLKMDIFKPANSTGNTPCVIFIHGGGGNYKNIAKNPNPTWAACYSLTKKGITVASVEYRDFVDGAVQPTKIYDVKGAVRFLRAHAKEYGIDPERFGVWGGSAGGQLSNIIALTGGVKQLEGDVGGNLEFSSKVQACVTYYGFTDFFNLVPDFDPNVQTQQNSARHDLANGAIAQNFGFKENFGLLRDVYKKNDTSSPYWNQAQLVEMCNPINYVDPNDPPVFLAHGGADIQIPYKQSYRLFEALLHNNVDAWMSMYSKGTHGVLGEDVDTAAFNWMLKQLTKPVKK